MGGAHRQRFWTRSIRSGTPILRTAVPEELLERAASDPDHLDLLRRLALRSVIIVPLRARGTTYGALLVAMSESGRSYGPEDLDLAEELADRCAIAVDNARLYAERSFVARTLQQAMLPARLPEIAGLEVALQYRAAAGTTDVGGDFDVEALRARVALAGHPLPLLARPGEPLREIGAPGQLLGAVEDPEIYDAEIDLEPGDQLLLYTDGVIEARDEHGQLGPERLITLMEMLGGQPPANLTSRLLRAVSAFETVQHDDIALVALRVTPERRQAPR